MLKDTIAWIAMLATCSQVLYGMSMQFRKLRIDRSTKGLSLAAVASTGFSYLAWSAWSLTPPGLNAYVGIPNTLGVFFTIAIFWQIYRLRAKKHD